jgi:hypothetical protein
VIKIWNFLLRLENTLSEVPLDRVLEVNVEIPPADPFARIFSYGTIVVRTAGQTGSIKLDTMPSPKKIQEAVFTQRDRYREIVTQRQRSGVYDDVQRALGRIPAGEQAVPPSVAVRNATVQTGSEQGLFFARTRFANQDGALVYRKHITVWLAHVFLPSLVVLTGLVIIFASFLAPESVLRGGVGFGGGLLVTLIGVIWFYLADWDWRNDVFIVANDTVTIIRKRPFWLQNETDRIRLSTVDNVVSDVSGFLNNLLNRGAVRVFLIGADARGAKILGPVHDPQQLQAELSRRQATLKAIQQQSEAQSNRQAIADYIVAYHQTVNPPAPGAIPQANPPSQSQQNQRARSADIPPAGAQSSAETQRQDQPPPLGRDGIRPPNVPRIRPDSDRE